MTQTARYETLSNQGATPERLATQARGEALERYVRALDAGPDDTVLEVGAGEGALGRLLARQTGARVWGADLDPDKVAWCESRAAAEGLALRYLYGDVQALAPGLRDRFSLVYCRYVLMYALPDAACARLLRAMAACVAPGGRLVAFEADIDFARRFHPPLPDWAASAFDLAIRYYRAHDLIDWRRGLTLGPLFDRAGLPGVGIDIADARLIRDGRPAALVAHDGLDVETLLAPALEAEGRAHDIGRVAACYRAALSRRGGVCYTPVFRFTWRKPPAFPRSQPEGSDDAR